MGLGVRFQALGRLLVPGPFQSFQLGTISEGSDILGIFLKGCVIRAPYVFSEVWFTDCPDSPVAQCLFPVGFSLFLLLVRSLRCTSFLT